MVHNPAGDFIVETDLIDINLFFYLKGGFRARKSYVGAKPQGGV